VVCSNSSSLPEIADNAALYFDPLSEQEIEDSISKVLYNEELKQRLIKNGRERLKKFSWEKTVNETLNVYRSVLN
jgi:glycosyltransferase involved in cell wall biosynthesis